MKKIIVFGCGNYAETLKYYIECVADWEIVAYTHEYVEIDNQVFDGKPLVPFSKIEFAFPPSKYEFIIALGYTNMNQERKRIYSLIKEKGYEIPNLIHPTAILNNAKIGDANIILENVVFEPNAVLGNNNIIWSAALFGHNTNVGDHNHFAACSLIAGNVKVGECCFLGNHSTVKDGVTLADFTLLGAGAYVSKDTLPYAAIVPARSVILENHRSTDFF